MDYRELLEKYTNLLFQNIMPYCSVYPLSTLLCRRHAQLRVNINFMHTMHKARQKSGGRRHAVISIIYEVNCTEVEIIWEQEVGGSNPLAPTS